MQSLPLRCLIIEDEPLAAEILANHIKQTPFLTLVNTCNDAIAALQFLHQEVVDVLFLDIRLPKLNGIDFLKTLRQHPKVIITSAYDEFAVAGFELQVVDYLLKPIEFSRFTAAVGKLLTPVVQGESASQSKERPYYFFNVNKRSVKIFINEIRYIESLNDSVYIHTNETSYKTNYQMGELSRMLPEEYFARIHRSFIVALSKIESFSSTEVQIPDKTLPIGRSYKSGVMERLKD